MARKMSPEPIKEVDLNQIIQAGIRVPDHGALNPWKLVIIQGEKLATIDKEIILKEYCPTDQVSILILQHTQT